MKPRCSFCFCISRHHRIILAYGWHSQNQPEFDIVVSIRPSKTACRTSNPTARRTDILFSYPCLPTGFRDALERLSRNPTVWHWSQDAHGHFSPHLRPSCTLPFVCEGSDLFRYMGSVEVVLEGVHPAQVRGVVVRFHLIQMRHLVESFRVRIRTVCKGDDSMDVYCFGMTTYREGRTQIPAFMKKCSLERL